MKGCPPHKREFKPSLIEQCNKRDSLKYCETLCGLPNTLVYARKINKSQIEKKKFVF